MSENLRFLLSQLDALTTQRIYTIARERNLPTNFDVIVTSQLQLPATFFIQRKGCERVQIAVALDYAASALQKMTMAAQKEFKTDFERRARNAIAFADKLNKSNPLVTGDVARVMNADRKELRRVPIMSTLDYALPERYFKVSSVVTVTCEMSGRTLSANVPFPGAEADTIANLKNELSRQLLIDDETASIIDLLESQRSSQKTSSQLESVNMFALEHGDQTIIHYQQKD